MRGMFLAANCSESVLPTCSTLNIKTRTHLELLLVGEANENVSVFMRLAFQSFIQRRQQGRTAPIVDYAVALGYVIEVSAHDEHLVRGSRQNAHDVRKL